jgi:hypothetical protein
LGSNRAAGKRVPPVDEQFRDASVQIYAMPESTFPIEFIGGSRDGEIIDATAAPGHVEVPVDGRLKEIYERQSDEPPFVMSRSGMRRTRLGNDDCQAIAAGLGADTMISAMSRGRSF